MKKSIGRVIAATAVGASVGYLASKGAFIDPAMPDALQGAMNAKLPDSETAAKIGGALGLFGQGGYEAGKRNRVEKQENPELRNKTQFKGEAMRRWTEYR